MNDSALIEAINTHRRRHGLLPVAAGVRGSGDGYGYGDGYGGSE